MSYPLRVTPAQWQDVREHYEEDWSDNTDELRDEEDLEVTDDARNREIRQRMLDNGRWPGAANGAPKPTGTSDEEWHANRGYYRKKENEDEHLERDYDERNGDVDPPF